MSHSRVYLAVFVLCLPSALNVGWTQEPVQSINYSAYPGASKFLGAIRVGILDLSTADTPTKTAKIALDQNAISFNQFGDESQTLVLYAPKDIQLTKVNFKDDTAQGRLLYDVEFVGQKDAVKEKVRLVWIPGTKENFSSVRLLLLNDKNNVTQTLELRQVKKG